MNHNIFRWLFFLLCLSILSPAGAKQPWWVKKPNYEKHFTNSYIKTIHGYKSLRETVEEAYGADLEMLGRSSAEASMILNVEKEYQQLDLESWRDNNTGENYWLVQLPEPNRQGCPKEELSSPRYEYLCWVPFGIPQFVKGQTGRGVGYLLIEGGVGVGGFFTFNYLRNYWLNEASRPGLDSGNKLQYRQWANVCKGTGFACLGIAGAFYILGIVDCVLTNGHSYKQINSSSHASVQCGLYPSLIEPGNVAFGLRF